MATIRALWDSNGALVSRDSPFFPLHNATFALPPYRGNWPEIWVAAHGPRTMRIAGRYADGWFPGTTRATNMASNSTSCERQRRTPGATRWPSRRP